MRILGLAGPAGSGKDTAAQFVLEWAEQRGLTAKRDAYADRLKISAMRSLGHPAALGDAHAIQFANALKQEGSTITVNIPEENLRAVTEPGDQVHDGPQEFTFSGRQFLQWYGTEGHRDVFGDDFWGNVLFNNYLGGGPDILVIPDVRFDNETQRILDFGGQIWAINRPYQNLPHTDRDHSSEAGIPDEALTCGINNSGSLDDLREAVFATCDALLGE